MATYSWRGGLSTHADPNDASDPANWSIFNGTAFVAATTTPQNNDTPLIAAGTVDVLATSSLDAIGEVFNVKGSNVVVSLTTATLDTGTLFEQTAGTSAALNFLGASRNRGQIAAIAPGGVLTVAVQANGPVFGLLVNDGQMFAANGGTLVVASSNGTLDNYGAILAYGGNVVLNAALNNTTGNLFVGGGSTFEVASSTGVGGGQTLVFLDTAGTVKLDVGTATGFLPRLNGFQNGDSIDLVGFTPVGMVESFKNGTLTLTTATSIVVATLRFSGSNFGLGTFQAPASDNNGGTIIKTVAAQIDPIWVQPSGGAFSGNFNDPTHWTGGAVPAAGTLALITAQSPSPYTVTINAAQAVTSLTEAAQTVSILVASGATLTASDAIYDAAGLFTVANGGAVVTGVWSETGSGGDLELQAGGSLRILGGSPAQAVSGKPGLSIENIGTVSGVINAAPATGITGGSAVIGGTGLGSLTVNGGGSVTDTYTDIAAFALSTGTLALTGATTRWTDGGGDTTTAYSGGMLVGGGGFSSITGLLSTGGAGALSVDQGAVLTDANFAVIGYSNLASGTATVSNNAQWNIGTGSNLSPALSTTGTTPIPVLTVGDFVSGSLRVLSGGTVLLSGLQQNNVYKMAIGYATGGGTLGVVGSGVVLVSGAGSRLDTGGGPLTVGQHGNGALSVTAGGSVALGNGGANSGFDFGAVVGSRSSTTGTGVGIGTVTVDGTGSMLTDTSAFIDGRDGTGSVVVSNSGSLAASGTFWLGGSSAGAGLGTGVLSVGTGGRLSATAMKLFAGSSASIDGAGTIEIGTLGNGAAGRLSIDPGFTLDGAGTITGNVADGGVVAADLNGAALTLAGGSLLGSGTLSISNGGTLAISTGVAFINPVLFGGVGTLRLQVPAALQGTIRGLAASDTIDLPGVAFSAGNAPVYNGTTGKLVYAGSTLDVGTGAPALVASADALGGSQLSVACFRAGTRILTEQGSVAVEHLRIGTRVVTWQGLSQPVRWIGRTAIDLGRHPQPAKMAPIRVTAEAFAPGLPQRDLDLSGDHSLWIDGALIPVHLLVNGLSIVRLQAVGRVEYFHVELPVHAVLLAEGLPAESYLDTGNRASFEGETIRSLHPDFSADAVLPSAEIWERAACGPLLLDGPILADAHRRLLTRAVLLGHRLSRDAAPAVEADGVMLTLHAADGWLSASVPAGTRVLRLRSRRMTPQERNPASDDRRVLGVALAELWLNGVKLDVAGPVSGCGFHAVEAKEVDVWRWTDGDAVLHLPAGGALAFRLLDTGDSYALDAEPLQSGNDNAWSINAPIGRASPDRTSSTGFCDQAAATSCG